MTSIFSFIFEFARVLYHPRESSLGYVTSRYTFLGQFTLISTQFLLLIYIFGYIGYHLTFIELCQHTVASIWVLLFCCHLVPLN